MLRPQVDAFISRLSIHAKRGQVVIILLARMVGFLLAMRGSNCSKLCCTSGLGRCSAGFRWPCLVRLLLRVLAISPLAQWKVHDLLIPGRSWVSSPRDVSWLFATPEIETFAPTNIRIRSPAPPRIGAPPQLSFAVLRARFSIPGDGRVQSGTHEHKTLRPRTVVAVWLMHPGSEELRLLV
jgi:hypothetical protein